MLLDRLAGWLSPQSGTTRYPGADSPGRTRIFLADPGTQPGLARRDETLQYRSEKVPRSAHMRFYGESYFSGRLSNHTSGLGSYQGRVSRSIAQLDTAISIWEPYGDAWQRRAYNKYVLNNYPAAEQVLSGRSRSTPPTRWRTTTTAISCSRGGMIWLCNISNRRSNTIPDIRTRGTTWPAFTVSMVKGPRAGDEQSCRTRPLPGGCQTKVETAIGFSRKRSSKRRIMRYPTACWVSRIGTWAMKPWQTSISGRLMK